MNLVESYSQERRGGWPVHCLLEDEDGHRVLLSQEPLPQPVLNQMDHAQMLVTWTEEGYLHKLLQSDLGGGLLCQVLQGVLPTYRTLEDMEAERKLDAQRNAFVSIHTHSEFCLAPETLVATADLKWKPIGDVVVGEHLIGFDEDLRPLDGQRGNSRSKMCRTEVLATKRVVRDCYRITLENGVEIISSAQHGWVVTGTTRGSLLRPGGPPSGYGSNTRKWLKTEELLPPRAQNKPKLVLWASPWEELPSELQREAGWLAGVTDGEGWLKDGQMALGQNPGFVLDEMLRVCKALGYETTHERVQNSKGSCRTFYFRGYETALRFLAQCKPVRFAGRWDEVWVGRRAGSRYSKPITVEKVEFVGPIETVALQTSTGTFVAEGFLSHNSALDGLSKVSEIVDIAAEQGSPGVFITDHGVCSSHSELQVLAAKKDIFGGCGIEANWVPDRFVRVDQYAYFHLILLAQNKTGLHNLWAASTEANRTGFYGRPRMDWDILQRFSEGLICSTACLRGPLSDLILQDRTEQAKAMLARFMDIFRDRTYLEIHSNTLPQQMKLNQALVDLGRELSLPIIAAVDSHYPCADDYDLHQLWLRAQISSKKGQAKVEGGDDSRLFQGHQDYHLMGRAEVRAKLDYLPPGVVEEAMDNTLVLLSSVEPYNITKSEPPKYAPDKGRGYATKRLLEICMANWDSKISKRRHTRPESAYMERFEYEMGILKIKAFTDYYMIVQDYVRWVKDRRILVGPGRGSGAASLVAYLAGITEVDPVEYDLPFARFITIDREDPPDFDLDFPSSKRTYIQDGITERWGFDYVMRVGTHGRLRNKGAINDMARVLRDSIPIDYGDIEKIKEIFEAEESDSAGLGKPWEVVMNAAEDALAPWVAKYPDLFEAAGRVSGRLKSYGKHAAGLVISTGEPLTGRLPMRRGADEDAGNESEQMVAEFDYRALEALGLLKFDILTLRTLDTLQLCLDLIRERKSLVIDVYQWQEEFDDPQVWEAISDGNTLGIFTFETPAMTEMIKRVRPRSIMDLAVINALGRPGPQRSGATELYLRRRAGQEQVVYDHPSMERVVADTYGLIIFQEQVMRTTQVLAGFSDSESEKVRKILGKKLKDEAAAKGEEFVKGCLANGVTEEIARKLWDQMATFSLYGFSICHSVPYAMLGYYCAWFRVHYPEEFFTALLSTVKKDDVPKYVNECKKLGFKVLPPDINESRKDFTAHPMAVRYGLLGIKGVGEGAVEAILAHQPYSSFEEFREKMVKTKCDMGVIKTLAAAGAFDSIYPNRRQLESFLELQSEGEDTRCIHKDPASVNSKDFICHFDWESEPVELTAKGKPKQRKGKPGRCTIACRHYEPQGLPTEEMEPYTPAEIREKEMEHLGVWLSSTPFDRIPAKAWTESNDGLRLYLGSEVSVAPTGTYMIAGIPQVIKLHRDRMGHRMAFLEVLAKDDVVSLAVFSSDWSRLKNQISIGKLGLYSVHKKDRKLSFKAFHPIAD